MNNCSRKSTSRPTISLLALALLILLACRPGSLQALEHEKLSFVTLDNPAIDTIGNQYATLQDRQGFLWFGGSSGLARYDGNSVKIFRHDPNNEASLSHSYVLDLALDPEGTIWVGTRNGLNRFDAEKETFQHFFKDPLNSTTQSDENVLSIFPREDGTLWLATGGGLTFLDPQRNHIKRYRYRPGDSSGISSNAVFTVLESSDGMVWAGTVADGLNRLNPLTGEFTHYRFDPDNPDGLKSNSIRKIFEDSSGALWIGTDGGGLHRMNVATGQFKNYRFDPDNPYSLGSDFVMDIAETDNGHLAIATEGGGFNLKLKNSERFIRYKNNGFSYRGIANNKVRTVFEDRDGDWWLGHFPDGISHIDRYGSSFSVYKHHPLIENSISNSIILSFEEDALGNLWVGTEEGLNYIDRKNDKIQRYNYRPNSSQGPAAPAILSLMQAKNGNLWIGTWGGELSYFDTKKQRFHSYRTLFPDIEPIYENRIWVIYEDREGNIWLGTQSGALIKLNPEKEKIKRYMPQSGNPNALTGGAIHSIMEDSHGNFWVGTYRGLNRFDRETETFEQFFHHDSDPTSLSDNHIWNVFEDSKGRLWVTTHGGGLNLFDPRSKNFRAYTTADGLANNFTSSIEEDSEGNLWIGTEMGLSRFNPDTEIFRNYYQRHGLAGSVYNRPASIKMRSGELVFGGTEGVSIFEPNNIFEDTSAPDVVFTELTVFNQVIKPGAEDSPISKAINLADEAVFRHDQSVFSIKFSALNYRLPDKNQYAYKLEGFDDRWNYVGNRNSATYTNLDPGKYQFLVKASNSEGVWNEKAASLSIEVLPPWWLTWWAYGMYLISALACAFLYLRSQKKKLALIEYVVEQRTQELREANRKLAELGNTDDMTGLKNRRFFNERCNLAFKSAVRSSLDLSLIVIDIDHFKEINDTFGHLTGDKALIEVSKLMAASVERDTDLLARIGGEEFGLLLPDTPLEKARQLAEKLREKIASADINFGENRRKITVSLGVCGTQDGKLHEAGIRSFEVLMRQADRALYQSKHEGRNRVTTLSI